LAYDARPFFVELERRVIPARSSPQACVWIQRYRSRFDFQDEDAAIGTGDQKIPFPESPFVILVREAPADEPTVIKFCKELCHLHLCRVAALRRTFSNEKCHSGKPLLPKFGGGDRFQSW
jgi:hypothetical protein